jgi:hypothetical protein
VRLRSTLRSQGEPLADLDALHRLDAHQRRGEPRVEPLLLGRVGAEAGHDAACTHLDDAPDGVAVLPGLVHPRRELLETDHRPLDLDADLV